VHSSVANLPESPEELAKHALDDGDRETALTLLMETYGDEIYRHCRQVIGDSDVAADVHQTVFVQAYRDLGSFGGRASFRTWLYAIARNRCLDALKMRRRRGLRFLLGVPAVDRPDPAPDVRDRMERHAQTLAMDRALDRLKPEVRIAVLLRYREDMSFEEMAEVCGERPATLQARVARALPKLRKVLERSEE
jgi:RNA polymerase sigma-70 factor (ECF subfamily)